MIQILVSAAGERSSCSDAVLAYNRRDAIVERLLLSTERGVVDLNAIGLIRAALPRGLTRKLEGHVRAFPPPHSDQDSLQALDIAAERQTSNSTSQQWRQAWKR
jgi:hypothetical protein